MLAASGLVIDFPPHTFSDTVMITYTVRAPDDAPSPGEGLIGMGRFFDLDAVYESTGQPAQPASGQSYVVTISYSEEEKGPAIEDTLALYYWSESQWVQEPSSVVDSANNTVTAAPDHLSLWAVLGGTQYVYLPFVLKD
jgi:hypothetical protein